MGLALVIGLLVPDARTIAGPALILGLAAAAIGVRDHPLLRGFGFTIWVFAFVAASMFYPGAFGTWFGFDLRHGYHLEPGGLSPGADLALAGVRRFGPAILGDAGGGIPHRHGLQV
jgi:hypothetical protein